MEISSLNMTKACRKNGRLVCFLKLSLPQADAGLEGERLDVFNSFYKSAAAEYEKLALRLAQSRDEGGSGVDFLYVSYDISEAENKENTFCVKRTLTYRGEGKTVKREAFDFYNSSVGLFVKRPKNMRKQRKTPSRKALKCEKTGKS